MSLRPGDVLGGKYEVESVLGEGGMGLVVAARHRELGHRVAIKCLHATTLGNEGAVARFEREARAAAALTSENVARVIDVERLEDGSPYMVMELLEGEDLHTMLGREGALSIVDTIRFATHAAEGLAEAHAAGIVHRDVKPSNLFVTRRKKGGPVVKVLDFGIAKNVSESADRNLTATQALLGSPQYMSPEQVRESKALDARTDVWALGVTMYECLTGRKPFDAPSMVDLCFAIVHAPPPRLTELRPDVPPKLEAVILRCLAKDPAERYPTMNALQDELALILSHVSGEVSHASERFARARAEALSQRSPDAFAATAMSSERVPTGRVSGSQAVAEPPPHGSKKPLVLAAIGSFVALGALVVVLRPHDPSKEPPPTVGLPAGTSATAPQALPPTDIAKREAATVVAEEKPAEPRGLAVVDAGAPGSVAGHVVGPARAPAAVAGKPTRKPATAPREEGASKSRGGLHMTIE